MARRGRDWDDGGWGRYVPVAERRDRAEREAAKRAKKGEALDPVVITGRTIARTFWGRAWCDNLERYSDFANRLPRGRTYARNGSVIDLKVLPGEVTALVMGSTMYRVRVVVQPVAPARWRALCDDCGGAVDSLLELLQGRLSKAVMERVCRQGTGLFPASADIRLSCSCPDGARMCKHVAAVLYGIGARLDERPELLFRLREVDEQELVAGAGRAFDPSLPAADSRLDAGDDLAALFGVELADPVDFEAPAPPLAPKAAPRPAPRERAAKRTPPAEEAAAPPPPTRARRSRRAPPAPAAATDAPEASAGLPKGTRVRMLGGVHAGRRGMITWRKDRGGDRFTYAVRVSVDGRSATTQVSSTSQGRMWEILPS